MKLLKKLLILPLGALPLVGLMLAAKGPADARAAQIARGQYLATVSGCNDCHTPLKMGPNGPEHDLTRLLSGHPEDVQLPPPPELGEGPWFAATAGMTAWAGPWGVSYAANLTPDPNTGLGIWTETIFIQAMRTGKHYGVARAILPPMPWQNVGAMSDADLKALFAYLQSLPPIANRVPQPLPPGGRALEFE